MESKVNPSNECGDTEPEVAVTSNEEVTVYSRLALRLPRKAMELDVPPDVDTIDSRMVRLSTATRVALAYHCPAYLHDLTKQINGMSIRHLQYLADLYSYALDGIVTHDLLVWESLLGDHQTTEVTPEVRKATKRRITDLVNRVRSISREQFVQEWLQRDGGVAYALTHLRQNLG